MAQESLIVELDARTKKLDAKLKATDDKLDKLSGTTKKADNALAKLSKIGGIVGSVLVKTTAATIAFGAAVSAMALKSATGRLELEQMARQAKTTEENFQSLAFATKQYGINAEQIADISKDISDKVGEFAAAGTGTFQDYADVMKLTKEEARNLAIEFQSLSSEQIIGKMVSEMEDAEVAGDQMTFVLESMGNDLSKLTPLFSENSAELKTMKARFDAVNSSLQITTSQADELKELSGDFDLLTSAAGNAATRISATLAPTLSDFFNSVTDLVPDATQAIIDFLNSFKSADEIQTLEDVNKQIESSREKLISLEAVANRVKEAREQNANTLNILTTSQERNAEKEFDAEEKRFLALTARRKVLEDLIELESISDTDKPDKNGISSGVTPTGTGTGDEIKAIEDRFKSEELLLQEKLERELEIVGENNELKLELEQEFQDNLLQIQIKAEETKQKALDDEKKRLAKLQKEKDKQAKLDGKIAKQNADRDKKFSSDAIALANVVFEDNKAVSAGIAVVNTATGITKALSTQDYAGAALTGIMGAAQIAAILGASKGGGSVPSVSGAPQQSQQPEFAPETSSLELTEQSGDEGSTTQRFIFADSNGNDLFDVLAQGLDERARNN